MNHPNPFERAPLPIPSNSEVQQKILDDFERALQLIIEYRRALNMLQAPDPFFSEVKRLLRRYKMDTGDSMPTGYKIMADGVDITEHPDSVLGDVVETEEIEESTIYAISQGEEEIHAAKIEKIELLRDNETGEMRIRRLGDE